MQRQLTIQRIAVTLEVMPTGNRRFRWSFDVPSLKLGGDGKGVSGLEAAFAAAERAARETIAEAKG